MRIRNTFTPPRALVFVIITILGVLPAACAGGGSVQGNTYVDNGGVVKIEFKAGGKAFFSMGPVTNTCTYSQSGKTVSLTCEGDKTSFTVGEDGALSGPPDGMIARLTKQK